MVCPPVLAAGRDDRLHEEPPRVAIGKQRERRRAQPSNARGVGDPEHGGHDHLEADRSHVELGGRGVPVGPACENLFGLALHRLVVAARRVAVERGELCSLACACARRRHARESRRAEEEMVRGCLRQRRSEAKHMVSAVKTRLMSSDGVQVASHGPVAGIGTRKRWSNWQWHATALRRASTGRR